MKNKVGLKKLGQYVSLRQGLAINASTAHLISDKCDEQFCLPLLRIADMVDNSYTRFISKDVQQSVKAFSGDIIYTRTGQIGLVFTNKTGVVHNNSFIVDLVSNELDKKYLFTILQSSFVRNQALELAKNSVQPDLTHDMFKSIEIPVPHIDEQKKIAKIYCLLNDAIVCNSLANNNLEQQLRFIYDYWFTQFDFPDENGKPYRTSGGKMVWNDELKREIPEGWECRTLSSLLHRHQQAFDYKSEQPTVDLSIMPTSSIAIEQTNSSSMFATNLYWMDEGDILFGSIRPYLKKAGIAPCNGVVAGTVHCFQVDDKHDYNFALFTLCGKNMFDYAVKVSKGTKMPVVSAEDILSYKVPYSKEISRLFNAFSIQKTICNNVKEIQQLTKLRDWLLPMLMNGQATVAD